jgi:Protein of unknown function (DUF3618)
MPARHGKDTSMTTQEELQQEIERTREHLGQTVDELTAKADVKARAQVKAAQIRTRARDRAAELSARVRQSQVVQRRWPVAVAAAGVLVAGSVAIWLRNRK